MSTGVIIAIIVIAVVIIGLLAVVLPRMRARAAERAQARELERRRERAVTESREQAEAQHNRADLAERHARIAEQEAARARAEANLHEERAELHQRGLADDELIDGPAGTPSTNGRELGDERVAGNGRGTFEDERMAGDDMADGGVAGDPALSNRDEYPARERIVDRERDAQTEEDLTARERETR